MTRFAAPRAVARRILANRDLRRVLPAYLLGAAAEFGTWVAILLYAYDRTGPASVGFVALAQLVPAAIVAPAAASLGDRYPRARVLAGGYVAQALGMLATGAAMLADLPVLAVYLVAVIAAASFVTTRPTQSSLLPSLAREPEDLTAANGATGMVEGIGVLIGPLVAAGILAVSTPASVFLLAGAAVAVSALLTLGLRPAGGAVTDLAGGELAVATGVARVPRAAGAATPSDAGVAGAVGSAPASRAGAGGFVPMARDPDSGPVEAGILAGLRALASDRDAALVVGLLTALMVTTGAADVLFVLLALDLLGTGESGAGILAASLGGGTIVGGALSFGMVGGRRLALAAAAGATAFGVALALVGLTGSPALAPLLFVLGGVGLAIVDIAGRTMLQRSVRDAVLSRVFGLQEGLAMAGLALGSVLVPVFVLVGGLVPAVVAIAAILPLVVLLAWRRLTDLDRRSVVPTRALALLRRTAVFAPLPSPQLEAVARRAVWTTVPAGTVVIREGDAGDRFFVLAGGGVRVDRGGLELRTIEAPGEGFGEIALLRGVPRTATVTALVDSELLAIDRAAFLAAVTGHPDAFAAAEREAAARRL
jgi:MFS family permease